MTPFTLYLYGLAVVGILATVAVSVILILLGWMAVVGWTRKE